MTESLRELVDVLATPLTKDEAEEMVAGIDRYMRAKGYPVEMREQRGIVRMYATLRAVEAERDGALKRVEELESEWESAREEIERMEYNAQLGPS